jgi:hypothetical protein
VCRVQEKHTEPRLSDAAADGQWQVAREQAMVIWEVPTGEFTARFQLTQEGGRIYPDAHRRELERTTEDWVPDKQVSVEAAMRLVRGRRPVIVVGRTAVVGNAVAQRRADTDDEHGTRLTADSIHPLLWCAIGVVGLQVFGGREGNLVRQVQRWY